MSRFAETIVPRLESWEAIRAAFRWPRPERFNMAAACLDRWAQTDPERVAVILPGEEGRRIGFGALARDAARFGNALAARGFGRGDVCAILLPQSVEVLLGHFGVWKLGGISLPLFTLFGEEAIEYRLRDSRARAIVTDRANLPKVLAVRARCPELETIWCIDGAEEGARDFDADLAQSSDSLATAATGPDDPALLVYTSGTTGPPKGALHGHRVLIGHLPCVECAYDFFPQDGDIGWTPADWAWMGGLMNLCMPCLYYGVPVVAHRMGKFDPEAAHELIARERVRVSFLPPTALKLMRQMPPRPAPGLRAVLSGGEALGADVFAWAQEALGVTVNEIYGQTECNLFVGNCHLVFPPKPGSMGRANPGAEVAILDAEGNPLGPGAAGEIAVRRDHMGMFLGYWNKPEKTAEKFAGEWMRTGDIGEQDAEGYFWFSGRDDDVISSGGYRIGPTEIEACLMGHPDVVMAAVVGVPDPVRGEAIKAFVVLREGAPREGIEAALIGRVRERLSPHLAPRSVEVIDAMPMTATGKIMRRELRGR